MARRRWRRDAGWEQEGENGVVTRLIVIRVIGEGDVESGLALVYSGRYDTRLKSACGACFSLADDACAWRIEVNLG